MLNFVVMAALTAPGQYPHEEIQKLINDRIIYGGYGTYGGCPASYAGCMPYARYCGAAYGPAIMSAPFSFAQGAHRKDHDEIHKRMEELKCSVDKLADSLLSLEKRLESNNKASQAKFKALEEQVKKQKKSVKKLEKKLDERIKPLEAKVNATDEGLKNLVKKLDDQARAAEIKALEDKIKKLEDAEKAKQVREEFTAMDRLKGLEGKILQLETFDRKRDEAIIQFLDQKLDRVQGNIKREIDSIHDQLKRFDGQLREEKDGRLRLEERLKNLERNLNVPPAPPITKEPAKEFKESKETKEKNQENLTEPKELKEPETREGRYAPKAPIKLAKSSQPRIEVPANKALLIIALPADARLYLNGKLTQSKGGVRTFYTPQIEAGADFAYTVRVEYVRNAELISQTRQVAFRGGRQVRVNFEMPGSQVQTVKAR